MRIKNKTLIIVSLSGLSLIGLALISSLYNSLILFSAAVVVVSSAVFYALYTILLKPLKKLETDCRQINTNADVIDHVNVSGKDEITAIQINVNRFLDSIQQSREYYAAQTAKTAIETAQQRAKLESQIQQLQTIDNKTADKENLTRIARYDNQSTLPNRVFFNEILNKAISHAKRHNKILAVLLINLSSFKKITAALNVVQSELILNEMSKRFTNVLRNEDIVAKLDGSEFIVLLNDIGKPKFASSVAEKILQICGHPMKIDDNEFTLTANIGICIFPHDADSLESVLKNAENALFKAAHAGDNIYQFYTHELDVEAREYIQLESALRKALHNNELTLYYQPKFSIKKGDIVGLEALMRWEHPVLGIINPSKFIPLAEETGLIMQIGEWAIREACRTSKYWQDEGYDHLTVSLNLSSKQFHHPEIAKIIANAVRSTGLNSKYLELEITETTVMQNVELATSILNTITATGVQISLDHFGTGYTSISALKQFPISRIKIDQTFIKSIPNIPNDMAITSAVIALAHNLGFEVVAEGVETAEQVQFLSSQNCDMVQGYFLGHPQTADKIILQFKKLHDEVLS